MWKFKIKHLFHVQNHINLLTCDTFDPFYIYVIFDGECKVVQITNVILNVYFCIKTQYPSPDSIKSTLTIISHQVHCILGLHTHNTRHIKVIFTNK